MHLNAHLDVDIVALDSDDTVTILLDLQAPAAAEDGAPRPEHTAVVVLDRSGSMTGGRLGAAKRALVGLVDRLDDRDRFGLVVFDDSAEVAIPAGLVGDIGRHQLRQRIAAVSTGGMTDLSSGYLRGLQEARRVCTATGATVVLLSDGHANSGLTDPQRLQQVAGNAAKQAITTSTIGIGTGYDETILGAVAEGGSGNHSFAEHADAAAAAVAAELDGLLTKTVQAASLMISPSGDVASIGVLNEGLPAQQVEGGVLVELGDFYGGEQRKVVLSLRVPASAALGLAQVATLALTYVELPTVEQHTITVPISVNVVPADIAAGRVPDPVVEREKLLLATQSAKREAEEALRRGDLDGARSTLDGARQRLANAPQGTVDDELDAEAAWLDETTHTLSDRDAMYNTKRLRSDYMRKHRGYKTRTQGGEVAEGDADAAGPQE